MKKKMKKIKICKLANMNRIKREHLKKNINEEYDGIIS